MNNENFESFEHLFHDRFIGFEVTSLICHVIPIPNIMGYFDSGYQKYW